MTRPPDVADATVSTRTTAAMRARAGVLLDDRRVSDLVIVGAGGHGREILTFVSALPPATRPRVAVVDDSPAAASNLPGVDCRFLGPIGSEGSVGSAYLLGIGHGPARELLSARLDDEGGRSATFVHPAAVVGDDAELGEGVVVFPNSVVTTNVSIGRHTHLNVGCAVQHDSTVGAFTQMSPGVLVNGDCRIGDRVFLGSGAIVTRGVTIGDDAEIGAGTVVLTDVPAGARCLGVPGRLADRPRPG